jgi:phosphoribosyl-AMP cyclohydrolase
MLDEIKWNEAGLVPAIAQQHDTGKVLMVAWMNREALETTLEEGRAVYFSRSRQKLWRKGEESGHVQQLKEIRIDCDSDVVLMQVDQIGGIACHTGRHHCFFKKYENGQWLDVEPVIKDEKDIYGNG